MLVLEVQCVSSEVCRLILVMIAAAAGCALTCVYVEMFVRTDISALTWKRSVDALQ
jgi:hypothetical protein